MTIARAATETVAFVDAYATPYRDLFPDVRSFDQFKRLHLGLIRDTARKSLPALGHMVGAEPQALHHFIPNTDWDVAKLRQRRLDITREALRGRSFVLCIDETGDQKYATVTDDVSRQYIGTLVASTPCQMLREMGRLWWRVHLLVVMPGGIRARDGSTCSTTCGY